MSRPPNIIIIESHDTGRILAPYGHAVATPHLQRLAKQGVLFTHAHCVAPTCSPSRAALFTGMCAHRAGMLGLGNRGFTAARLDAHLAHTLARQGYLTAGADNHMGLQNTGQGIDALGYRVSIPWGATEAAVDFIRQNHAQPFFLSLNYGLTHRQGTGFATPADRAARDPRYVVPPAPLVNTPETRADWAHFLGDVETLDREIGIVLAALASTGLEETTLVIVTTDHGPPFPGMKCNLNVHGTGVFLIMRGPRGFRGGKVVDALVSHLDLYPTICDTTGGASPAWLEGRSLLPLVEGTQDRLHETIHGEVTYHAAYEPMRMARSERFVYIRRFSEPTRPVLPNCDDSPSKDAWLRHGHADRLQPAEQLFDTFFDPAETHNLAADPTSLPVLETMRECLDDWMKRTADPLLTQTPIPLPPGAWADAPTASKQSI